MSMNDIKLMAMQTALNKMLENSSFSICTLDDLIKSAGTIPDREAYQALRLLHCVDYKDMPRDLRTAIPQLVAACLQEPKLCMSIDAMPIGRRIDPSLTPAAVLSLPGKSSH